LPQLWCLSYKSGSSAHSLIILKSLVHIEIPSVKDSQGPFTNISKLVAAWLNFLKDNTLHVASTQFCRIAPGRVRYTKTFSPYHAPKQKSTSKNILSRTNLSYQTNEMSIYKTQIIHQRWKNSTVKEIIEKKLHYIKIYIISILHTLIP
jgi:hypothetical protein